MENKIEDLIGETLMDVKGGVGDGQIIFTCASGRKFGMSHDQSCCESVDIEDICGDISDLIGVPILSVEESTSSENPPDANVSEFQDSFTWTFYRIGTIKGDVTIRWYGESNGYYSEAVNFYEVK